MAPVVRMLFSSAQVPDVFVRVNAKLVTALEKASWVSSRRRRGRKMWSLRAGIRELLAGGSSLPGHEPEPSGRGIFLECPQASAAGGCLARPYLDFT
jgi:hypothetical protein